MNTPAGAEAIASAVSTPAGLVVVLFILGVVLVALLSLVGYLLKSLQAQMKEQLTSHQAEIKRIWETIARRDAQMPVQYVLRDDWVRMSTTIDRRLDQILDRMDDLPCKNGGGCEPGNSLDS
jgi:hypothetical protein